MHYAALYGTLEVLQQQQQVFTYTPPKQKQHIYTVHCKPLKSGDQPSVKQTVRHDLK